MFCSQSLLFSGNRGFLINSGNRPDNANGNIGVGKSKPALHQRVHRGRIVRQFISRMSAKKTAGEIAPMRRFCYKNFGLHVTAAGLRKMLPRVRQLLANGE